MAHIQYTMAHVYAIVPVAVLAQYVFLFRMSRIFCIVAYLLVRYIAGSSQLPGAYLFMADRATKLRKLNQIRRKVPQCSVSAIASILEEVKKHGMPEGRTDRKAFRKSRDAECAAHTPYGLVVQTMEVWGKDDELRELPIAHPMALLWKATKECSSFRNLFLDRLQSNPPSIDNPLGLIIYTDEVTPGDPLAPMNLRKFHIIYWTFMELGFNALSREESWFTVAAPHSTVVNELSAGLSQVMAAVLTAFFPSDGMNFQTTGVLLDFGEHGSFRVWARVAGFLMDGGAHKYVWHSRGDGASKFCLLCKNEFSQVSNMVDEDGSNLLCCNTLTHAKLELSSSRDIRKVARYIEKRSPDAAAHGGVPMANPAFIALQQALGMTYHKHALLLNRRLDAFVQPVEAYMHDWMHAIFVDGIWNHCVFLLLESMIRAGYKDVYTMISDYIALWTWPCRIHQSSSHFSSIFSEDRKDKHRKAKRIKCQASDGLSMTAVIALFTMNVLMKLTSCPMQECIAFLALVDLIEIIQAMGKKAVQPQQLLDCCESFLKHFKAAWGYEWMTTKFHWILHFKDQLERSPLGKLLACFCLERKHRAAKRYAGDMSNTTRHNGISLLKEVICHHLGQLDDPVALSFAVGLVNGRKPSKKVKQLLTTELDLDTEEADSIEYDINARFSPLGSCHKGDLVLYFDIDGTQLRAGVVQLHCQIQGLPITMISELKLHKLGDQLTVSNWIPLGTTCIETEQIVDTAVFRNLPDGKVSVLLPAELR